MTNRIAKGLARAFGTSSVLWVRLQTSFNESLEAELYRAWVLKHVPEADQPVVQIPGVAA